MKKQKERFCMTLSPESLAKVDSMAKDIQASRVVVMEIIVAFYFLYVGLHKREKPLNRRPCPRDGGVPRVSVAGAPAVTEQGAGFEVLT